MPINFCISWTAKHIIRIIFAYHKLNVKKFNIFRIMNHTYMSYTKSFVCYSIFPRLLVAHGFSLYKFRTLFGNSLIYTISVSCLRDLGKIFTWQEMKGLKSNKVFVTEISPSSSYKNRSYGVLLYIEKKTKTDQTTNGLVNNSTSNFFWPCSLRSHSSH